MNYASEDEELRFLRIFAKDAELSSVDLAAQEYLEREERAANATRNATQQLTLDHRQKKKVKGYEKQRLAQFEVTTQGYASALHLHRNKNAVNRAARDLVDEQSRPTAGLPVAVVKGDKVETSVGVGVVEEVRNNGAKLIVSVGWGLVHLQTSSLVNYGVGAVPISLESAYQRAKAMYTAGQVEGALAVWMQGVKMLKSRRKPPCAALALYLAAASQAERSLGLSRKALTHATDALHYARNESSTSSKSSTIS